MIGKQEASQILVLQQQGMISQDFNSQLDQLQKSGIIYDIKKISNEKSIPESEQEIVSFIHNGNYQIVLIDRNVKLPIWGIIDKLRSNTFEPKFYLDGRAENILSREMQFTTFCGALRVDKHDQLLFQSAKGLANKSKSVFLKESPNTLNTQYNIASIGKMLTAVAVVCMAKDKSISENISVEAVLNTPIRDLVRSDYQDKNFFADFTLHELLMHISGLKTAIEEPYFKSKMMFFKNLDEFKPWVESLIRERNLKKDLKREVTYSNAGFTLLGLAIEAITGEDYYKYLKQKVLLPAHMINTVPKVTDADPRYAFNHTLKPGALRVKDNFYSVEQIIPIIEQAESLENKQEVACLLEKVQNLLEIVLELQKNFNPRIEELAKNLEIKLLEAPADFSQIKQDYANEVQIIGDALYAKFPHWLEELEATDRAVNEWFSKNDIWLKMSPNHETTKNMQILRELLEHPNLPANLLWSFNTLASFINHFAIASPAGKWRSTAKDLSSFNKALWHPNGALADCAKYLIANTVDLAPNEKYGYGIVIKGDGDMVARGHTGALSGACSSCFYYPKQNYSVVTLVNDEDSVGLFMAFEGIEKHLVFAIENGIIYLDKELNTDGQKILLDNLTYITSHNKNFKLY